MAHSLWPTGIAFTHNRATSWAMLMRDFPPASDDIEPDTSITSTDESGREGVGGGHVTDSTVLGIPSSVMVISDGFGLC